MKIDNNIMRQMSVGLDSARNSNKARQAEPDAFGQLFASMSQASQAVQDRTAEVSTTKQGAARNSKVADERKVEANDSRRGARVDEAASLRDEQHDDTDVVGESTAGAAGVKAEHADTQDQSNDEKQMERRLTPNGEGQIAAEVLSEDGVANDTATPTNDKSGQENASIRAKQTLAAESMQHNAAVDMPEQQAGANVTQPADDASLQVNELQQAYGEAMRKLAAKSGTATESAGVDEVTTGDGANTKPRGEDKRAVSLNENGANVNVAQAVIANGATVGDSQAGGNADQKTDMGRSVGTGTVQSGAMDSAMVNAAAQLQGTQHTQHGMTQNAGTVLTADTGTMSEADAQRLAQQTLGSVRSLANQGSGQGAVTLRLNPPELGALRISVRMDGPMLSATFEASNATVSSLLQSQMHSLRAALEHAGLGVEHLSVQSPAPLPTSHGAGAQFGSSQQQMDQSPSDGRSRGWMGDGGGASGQQQRQGTNQETDASFQRELLNLVA